MQQQIDPHAHTRGREEVPASSAAGAPPEQILRYRNRATHILTGSSVGNDIIDRRVETSGTAPPKHHQAAINTSGSAKTRVEYGGKVL